MDWTTLFSFMLTGMIAYAIFSDGKEQSEEEDLNDELKERQVEMICGTCRKFQVHEIIEPYLFKCKKCGRETRGRG